MYNLTNFVKISLYLTHKHKHKHTYTNMYTPGKQWKLIYVYTVHAFISISRSSFTLGLKGFWSTGGVTVHLNYMLKEIIVVHV